MACLGIFEATSRERLLTWATPFCLSAAGFWASLPQAMSDSSISISLADFDAGDRKQFSDSDAGQDAARDAELEALVKQRQALSIRANEMQTGGADPLERENPWCRPVLYARFRFAKRSSRLRSCC